MSLSSEEESFEVETILDQRKRGRVTEYLVHWKGYGGGEDTWESERQLRRHAQDAIDQFNNKPKSRTPRRAAANAMQQITSSSSASRKGGETTTVTKVTTRTTTTSRAGTTSLDSGAQSESSSREGSPVLSRRVTSFGQDYVQSDIRKSDLSKTSTTRRSCCGILHLTKCDIPIVILISCLLLIALTFVVEQK